MVKTLVQALAVLAVLTSSAHAAVTMRMTSTSIVVSGAGNQVHVQSDSPLLAGVSILLYLIGFALLSRPTGFADKTVVVLASAVMLLSLVLTFWARNAGNTAVTRVSGFGLNAGGLAVIALLGLHLMRAAIRHRRR